MKKVTINAIIADYTSPAMGLSLANHAQSAFNLGMKVEVCGSGIKSFNREFWEQFFRSLLADFHTPEMKKFFRSNTMDIERLRRRMVFRGVPHETMSAIRDIVDSYDIQVGGISQPPPSLYA